MTTDSLTTVVACLVTDKKYRKMGGEEGLQAAITLSKKQIHEHNTLNLNLNIKHKTLILQVRVEELLLSHDFEGNFINLLKSKFQLSDCEICDARVVIVHKYSDFFKIPGIRRENVLEVRDWLCRQRTVLDDPEKIDILSNRVQTGNLVRKMCKSEGFEELGLQWPEFHVQSMGEMTVPVIVKPVDACSTDESHWMTLVTDEGKFDGFPLSEGVLVQQFYEHFSVLYKVYLIGESVEIVARPSISARNLTKSGEFRFNTHKFKALAGNLPEEQLFKAMQRMEPLRGLVEKFAWLLKDRLKLTWFGIDVLIPERGDLKAAVIDVNYMPGFDGVTGLTDKLIKAILD